MRNDWLESKRFRENLFKPFNARFLQEAKEIEARWAKTGLLNGIKDDFSRATTAVLLESQRLFNEK